MLLKKTILVLSSIMISGLFAMNAHAHDGGHAVVSSSGNPVKSSSGCVTSSGGSGSSEGCGGEMAAPAAMPAPAPAAAPAPAPAPAMMKPAKAMGAGHSHPANRCTNSIMHNHAAPSGHSHRYSCQGNSMKKMAAPSQMTASTRKMTAKMAKPHQSTAKMAKPRQRAY